MNIAKQCNERTDAERAERAERHDRILSVIVMVAGCAILAGFAWARMGA